MEAVPISTLAELDFATPGLRRALLARDDLPFGLHYEHRPGAQDLVVTFSNLLGRSLQPPPSFDTLGWASRKDYHLLSICDPTLFLDERIECGVFLGTEGCDPVPGLEHIVREAANLLRSRRVLLWGGSGGGFAAVKVASRTGFSAVAINTQVAYWPLRHWSIMREVARVFGARSMSHLYAAHPLRASILAELGARSAQHILWATNTEDIHHYARHYPRVCEMYGLPLAGGTSRDGRLTALTYTSPEGHGPAPDAVHNMILDFALARLRDERPVGSST